MRNCYGTPCSRAQMMSLKISKNAPFWAILDQLTQHISGKPLELRVVMISGDNLLCTGWGTGTVPPTVVEGGQLRFPTLYVKSLLNY